MGSGVEVSKQGVEAAVCLGFASRKDVEARRPRLSKSMSKGCRSPPTSTLERSGQVFHRESRVRRVGRLCSSPGPVGRSSGRSYPQFTRELMAAHLE
jgi:hypothetical protein